MNEANPLVPVDQEELDNADAMLASLTTLAYATEAPKKAAPVKEKKHTSRFFFRLSKSFAEEVQEKREQFKPKQLTHADQVVEKLHKDYRKRIPSELEHNIERVREFFLREIAPITLAASAGTGQAIEVVKRLTNSDVDGTQFEKFERMMAHAVNIKMARFICRELGMTRREANEVLQLINQPRTPALIPVGVPANENQRSVQHGQAQQGRTKGQKA